MLAWKSLLAELEDAIHGSSRDRRVETLRRITDLFLSGANRFNDEQIGLFEFEYAKLSITSAGRVLRFCQVHQKISPEAGTP